MSAEVTVVAVDLGAASGRVMTGRVGADRLDLAEAHRFPNEPVALPDGLYWDVLRLYRELLAGLDRVAASGAAPASVGIDSWAVDYGLLDATGALVGNPVHYRDPRSAAGVARVHAAVPPEELYRVTGLQHLPFNTVFQLAAARDTPAFAAARTLLLVPDLLGYWLTGRVGAELTNASTTGLLDLSTMDWSPALVAALGLPPGLLPPIHRPGTVLGALRPGLPLAAGGPGAVLRAVGSHDTASAVAGVPAGDRPFAYVSSGTWSLVGLELDRPVRTEASRAANFTNEVGVDGRIRFLRNVAGLWLLQESMRAWHRDDLAGLLAAAARETPLRSVIDPDDPEFLPPGDLPARIAAACVRRGEPEPDTPARVVRCVLDSLALAYRAALRTAARLADRDVEVVHVVGGGARNELLCQLTADACGLPVLAGPAEATALGNVLVQAVAAEVLPDLAAARRLVARTQPVRRYDPRPGRDDWAAAAVRAAPR
ncbi:rhamnulokinase family protein [Micromonospora sp. NPDC049559]|uniref:rhamnulokinase n=1 Tax=Micromonospora sp. NPDC049559 TaxID=3155923 RepID=UPI003427F3DA